MAVDKTKILRERIAGIIQLAESSKSDEIKSELACYAAVMTSGLVESSLRKYCLAYTAKRANPDISHYVESQLYYFQNAKYEKIEVLLRSFSATLFKGVADVLFDEEIAAIDSVVNNKNNLAHGNNTGLSLGVMREYFRLVCIALPKIQKALS